MFKKIDLKTWVFWLISCIIVAGIIMWGARELFVIQIDTLSLI